MRRSERPRSARAPRTIEQGYVTIGADKLALPTIRINYGMGLDALIGLIG